MTWHFREQNPGDPTRDPIVGEFFSTDAITNPAEALVREGIQNSLDAGIPGIPVRIRIGLGTNDRQLPASRVRRWLGSAWLHIEAPGNGLREPPEISSPCPYLVFEDFGTSGLTGDPEQPFDEPGTKNLFFYFFRAEGRSSKGEMDRGRWGVGKHVFPRASLISTTFGYTVRADDGRSLLMGHAVLKSHKLEGAFFTPDAYFGTQRQDRLVLPFEKATVLDIFRADFNLHRSNEPGLSIVVPFLDGEFTRDNLAAAVISGYFHPILEGKLVVTIDSDEGSLEVTAATLLHSVESLEPPAQAELRPLVEIARWYSSTGKNCLIELPPCNPDRPAWDEALIPGEMIPKIRGALDAGDYLAIRCHLTVRQKGHPARPSYFDVCLRQGENDSGKVVFIREGIIIANVKAPRTRGIRSLVIVEDKPLATLLGDSENPAHTEWQKDSSNFKGKYVYGKSYIEFVARAAAEIIQRARADEDTPDKTLLLDIFSLPSTTDDNAPKRSERKPKHESGDRTGDDVDSIEPRRRRFRITKTPGGFIIQGIGAADDVPALLRVRVAYDVRKGNPLSKYSPIDFRLGASPTVFDPPPHGIELTTVADNRLVARVVIPDFRLTVKGFDERRDLFVSASMEDTSDAA